MRKKNSVSVGQAIISIVLVAIGLAFVGGAAAVAIPTIIVGAAVGAVTVLAALASAFCLAGVIAVAIMTWHYTAMALAALKRAIFALPGLALRLPAAIGWLVSHAVQGLINIVFALGKAAWPYLVRFGQFVWPWMRPWFVPCAKAVWWFLRECGRVIARIALWLDSIGWIHRFAGIPLRKLFNLIPWTMVWQKGIPFWIYNPDATDKDQDRKNKAWAWWVLATVIISLVVNIESGVMRDSLLGKMAKAWDLNLVLLGWGCFWVIVATTMQQGAIAYGNGQRTTLQLFWRKWETTRGANWLYDEQGKMYNWVTQNPKLKEQLPNYDYTLVQDSNDFPSIWPNLCYAFGEAGLKLVSYGILLLTVDWILTLIAFGWILVSNVLVPYLGRMLGALAGAAFNSESDLKVTAGRGRTEAEYIALGGGERVALLILVQKIVRVWQVWMDTMRVNRRLQFFQGTWFNIIPAVVTFIMAAKLGHIPYGEVIAATGYFTGFYQAANVYADQYGNIENLRQVLIRLCTFENIAKDCIKDAKTGKHIHVSPSDGALEFKGVKIPRLGTNGWLWDNFTWTHPKGAFVLWIAPDPQAQGLSTMIRTIMGFVNAGEGEIAVPRSRAVLAPRGDVFPCTLRQFLSDPKPELVKDDQLLLRALTLIGLEKFADAKARPDIGGLDGLVGAPEGQPIQKDWINGVSKTELQKLLAARILLHQPDCVMVEAAGLNEDDERLVYTNLRGKPERTVFTAGFASPLLLAMHDFVGVLLPDGKWEAPVPVEEFKKKHPELLGSQPTVAPAATTKTTQPTA